VSRKKEDFTGGKELSNENHGLNPVHDRHGDIADDEVEFCIPGELDGFDTGIDGRSIEPSLIENYTQRISDDMLIIHHEYAGLWLGFQGPFLFKVG
jgi:hypothetical protein